DDGLARLLAPVGTRGEGKQQEQQGVARRGNHREAAMLPPNGPASNSYASRCASGAAPCLAGGVVGPEASFTSAPLACIRKGRGKRGAARASARPGVPLGRVPAGRRNVSPCMQAGPRLFAETSLACKRRIA